MRHVDLGVLDDPVLLFGGPYSNAQALGALFAAAQDRGIAPHQMICTGDIVAYCGAPQRTTAMIRAMGCAVVAGNCEIQLGSGAADCGCGFEDGTACDLLSARWFGYAAQALSDADRIWMAARPDMISFYHQGARYAVIHGGVRDVARFVWEMSPESHFLDEWDTLEQQIGAVDHIIAGHCGIPFLKTTPRGQWINAGVIGMPPHDGRQQTRFALLDGGEVQFHRLSYDVEAAQADMTAAGLAEDYKTALRTGYWPSEDVLPAALRFGASAKG